MDTAPEGDEDVLLHRIVFRWDQNGGLTGVRGLAPVATSLTRDELPTAAASLDSFVSMRVSRQPGRRNSLCWVSTKAGRALVLREYSLHAQNRAGNDAHVVLDSRGGSGGDVLGPFVALALASGWQDIEPPMAELPAGYDLPRLSAAWLTRIAEERRPAVAEQSRALGPKLARIASAMFARPHASFSLQWQDAGPDPVPLLWGLLEVVVPVIRGSRTFSTFESADGPTKPRFVVVPAWPLEPSQGRRRIALGAGGQEATRYLDDAKELVSAYVAQDAAHLRELQDRLRKRLLVEIPPLAEENPERETAPSPPHTPRARPTKPAHAPAARRTTVPPFPQEPPNPPPTTPADHHAGTAAPHPAKPPARPEAANTQAQDVPQQTPPPTPRQGQGQGPGQGQQPYSDWESAAPIRPTSDDAPSTWEPTRWRDAGVSPDAYNRLHAISDKLDHGMRLTEADDLVLDGTDLPAVVVALRLAGRDLTAVLLDHLAARLVSNQSPVPHNLQVTLEHAFRHIDVPYLDSYHRTWTAEILRRLAACMLRGHSADAVPALAAVVYELDAAGDPFRTYREQLVAAALDVQAENPAADITHAFQLEIARLWAAERGLTLPNTTAPPTPTPTPSDVPRTLSPPSYLPKVTPRMPATAGLNPWVPPTAAPRTTPKPRQQPRAQPQARPHPTAPTTAEDTHAPTPPGHDEPHDSTDFFHQAVYHWRPREVGIYDRVAASWDESEPVNTTALLLQQFVTTEVPAGTTDLKSTARLRYPGGWAVIRRTSLPDSFGSEMQTHLLFGRTLITAHQALALGRYGWAQPPGPKLLPEPVGLPAEALALRGTKLQAEARHHGKALVALLATVLNQHQDHLSVGLGAFNGDPHALLWGLYDLITCLSGPRDPLTFSTYEIGKQPIDTVGVDAPRLVFSPQRPDLPRQERRHIELDQVKRHQVADLMVRRYLNEDWALVYELLTETIGLHTLDLATRNRELKRIFTP